MKKVILSVLAISLGACVYAQKKNVNTALMANQSKEYDDAKAAIDAAVLDEVTKNEAKTWFVYGDVYNSMASEPKYKDNSAKYQLESAKGYLKAIELDPKYKPEEMTNRLDFTMRVYFNEGLHAYNEKKYKEAYEYLGVPVTIRNLDGGKRFNSPLYDTIASSAQLNKAYSAYFAEEYEKAIAELIAVKDNPIVSNAGLFRLLSDIYAKQNKEAEANKILDEGIAKYPDDKDLRSMQLNKVIQSGKLDELVKKLEDNVAREPNNPETVYMLGITYYNMATPRDNSGKDAPKPANYEELLDKAEKAYSKAIELDKKDKPNPAYSYNLGVIYFNQASDINKKMTTLGTSAADNKKYDELKAKRDAMFTKSLEPLERAYNILDPKASTLSADEKNTYSSTLLALKQIYAATSQTEKMKMVRQKIADLK